MHSFEWMKIVPMPISVEEIRCNKIFDRLPTPTLEAIAEIARPLAFDRHHLFYRQEEPPPGIFFLRSGRVKLYRQFGSKIQILMLVQVGDIFGTEVLAPKSFAACNAEAITKGDVLHLPADRFRHLLGVNAELSLVFLELLSNQFMLMSHLVHNLVFHNVSTRLAEFLLRQEPYQSIEGYCITRNFSQEDLAAAVGARREVVCRTLGRFEKEGILRLVPRKIIILDLSRLVEIAQIGS